MPDRETGSRRQIGWSPATTGPALTPDIGQGHDDTAPLPRRNLPGVMPVVLLLLAAILALASIVMVGIPRLPGNEPEAPPAPRATTLPGAFTYQQQRSLSCEYASLSIATTMIGRPVSEYDIERVVPLADNPHRGYRGDIEGEWGNTDDYGVYNEPLAEALPSFGLRGEAIYGSREDLMRELDLGRPTVVWLAMRGDDASFDAFAADGERYQLTQWMHVMLAYGYDETGVYLTDPGTAVLRHYDWTTFIAMWEVMDGMALSVHE